MRKIFRWVVPVDDMEHEIRAPWISSDPTRVAAASPTTVEFWCEVDTTQPETGRLFQIVGTGHPIPHGWSLIGTSQRVEGLVWHLLERRPHWS